MFQRQIPKVKLTHLPTELRPLPLVVFGLTVVAIIITAGFIYDWQLWQLLVFSAFGLTILVGGFLLVRWWSIRRRALESEKQAARELEKNLHPDQHVADAVETLRRKWSDALQTIRGTGIRGLGDAPIYRAPWYLVLGESECGKTSLIKGAHPQMPVFQNISPTQNCDWYFFGESILLDTAGRYVHGAKAEDEAEWKELLSLLRQDRKWEPINGVIIAVAADALISRDTNSLRLEAGRLRKRLDEIVNRLGVKFPVYLVVTKLDKIAGFSEFFKDLPHQALDQAMGASDRGFSEAEQSSFFEQAFASISRKLEDLKLGLISLTDRLPIGSSLFTFPGEFKSLQDPLRVYVNTLFLQNPYQEIPGFRGLFFTSANQDDTAISLYPKSLGLQRVNVASIRGEREYFINHIVSTILPKDRTLVRRTRFWGEEFKTVRAGWLTAVVAGCLLIAGLFTLSWWLNSSNLKHLVMKNCAFNNSPTVIQSLGDADRCRESIAGLRNAPWWKRPFFGFGLDRIGELERRLKQRFVDAVYRRAVVPLDTKILASLNGPEAPVLASIMARRIKALAECLDNSNCETSEYKLNRDDYLQMLKTDDPGINVDGAERVVNKGPLRKFQDSYEASLVWGRDSDVLSEHRLLLGKTLAGWINKNYRWTDMILQSVRVKSEPSEFNAFWDEGRKVTVNSTYTGAAWSKGIAPLIRDLTAVAADLKDAKDEVAIFELDYRNETLRQWKRVLVQFSEGSASVSRPRKEWAFKVMDSNPSEALLNRAFEDLSKLPAGWIDTGPAPTWVKTLQRYQIVSKLAAMPNITGKEEKAAPLSTNAQAAKHLSAYREGLRDSRNQLVTPKESYQAAREAFAEGAVSEKSKNHIIKAQWNLEQLRKIIRTESDTDDDDVLWRLLRLPLVLCWKSMLNEAGKQLQEEWKKVWIALPDNYQKPGQKAREILTFVTDQAGAFLDRRGNQYVAQMLLDEKVAFRAEFLGHIGQLTSYSPETLVDLRFPEEIIQTR